MAILTATTSVSIPKYSDYGKTANQISSKYKSEAGETNAGVKRNQDRR